MLKKHLKEIVINELDAGHCPHDVAPEEVNSIIWEWVVNVENRCQILEQKVKDNRMPTKKQSLEKEFSGQTS